MHVTYYTESPTAVFPVVTISGIARCFGALGK
jgi:hypothetical protein